ARVGRLEAREKRLAGGGTPPLGAVGGPPRAATGIPVRSAGPGTRTHGFAPPDPRATPSAGAPAGFTPPRASEGPAFRTGAPPPAVAATASRPGAFTAGSPSTTATATTHDVQLDDAIAASWEQTIARAHQRER